MPGIFSPAHLLLILAIVLIVFGPGKLPDAASALGKSVKNFKKAMSETEEIENSTDDKSDQH